MIAHARPPSGREKGRRLQVTHVITGLTMGGAERALHSLLSSGLATEVENSVIALSGRGHYGPLLEAAGVPLTCLDMAADARAFTVPSRLRAALIRSQPDILQGWMYHGNLVASLARPLADGAPAVAWNIRTSLDNPALIKGGTRLVSRICKSLSPRVDRIIYNSSRSCEQHCRVGYAHRNATVIPNGFDLANWPTGDAARGSARQRMAIDFDALVVGYVGRGAPVKDVPTLISAFRQVLRQHANAILVLVGRDLDKFDMAGIPADSLRLMGQQADVAELLPGFDLLALTSLVEGFPNVLGEAMACGVPCVVTDVGDAAMVVGDTGWVVPPGESEPFATALDEALSLPRDVRTRRGAHARQRIASRYSLDRVAATYLALYEAIVGRR